MNLFQRVRFLFRCNQPARYPLLTPRRTILSLSKGYSRDDYGIVCQSWTFSLLTLLKCR